MTHIKLNGNNFYYLLVLLFLIGCSKRENKVKEHNNSKIENSIFDDFYANNKEYNSKQYIDSVCMGIKDLSHDDLENLLKYLHERDQRYRVLLIDSIHSKNDRNPVDQERKSRKYRRLMDQMDKENILILGKIIEYHGLPVKSKFGVIGGDAAFLVIAHCGSKIHYDKYFPLFMKAYHNKEIDSIQMEILKMKIRAVNN